MDDFEVFPASGRGRRGASGPSILVSRSGNIVLNDAAVGLFQERLPAFVQLLFSRKRQIVAIRPAEEGDENVVRLRESKASKSRTIGAKAFFENYGVDTSERRTYGAYTIDGAVAFNVGDDEEPKPQRRRRVRTPDEG